MRRSYRWSYYYSVITVFEFAVAVITATVVIQVIKPLILVIRTIMGIIILAIYHAFPLTPKMIRLINTIKREDYNNADENNTKDNLRNCDDDDGNGDMESGISLLLYHYNHTLFTQQSSSPLLSLPLSLLPLPLSS